MKTWAGRGRTAVAGIGRSDVVRHTDEPLALAATQACRAAVADAGLNVADVDGLATFPSLPYHGAVAVDGQNFVSVDYMLNHLGASSVRWYSQIAEGMAASAIVEAVNALLAGVCDYALVWRALGQPKGQYGVTGATEAAGDDQYGAPWGFSSIIQGHAVAYQRYLSRYGADPDAMTTLVTASRANAADNPYAYFRDKPMSASDYRHSRMIADPIRMLDCDIPVHAAVALVLTRAELAKDLVARPAYVLAAAQQTRPTRKSVAYMMGDHIAAGGALAQLMWTRAGLGPDDIDVAELYDGFSPSVYYWLESAGFCGEGEAHAFIQNGAISRDGRLPLNTFGGSLSEGRLHGMGHVAEAALQVMGRAGPRQVTGAAVSVAMTGSPLLRSAGIVLGAHP